MINEGCRKWKSKSMMGVLCRLVLSSTVYGIWRARNETKYHGKPKTEEQIGPEFQAKESSRRIGKMHLSKLEFRC